MAESPAEDSPAEEPSAEVAGEASEPRREPFFNIPPVIVAVIAICAAIHLIRLYVLTTEQDIWVLLHSAFIPIRYSGQFALDIFAATLTVTYAFLHGSLPHLAVNMVWLAAFGSPLANRLGVLRFCLFFLVTTLAAVALHYVLHMYDQAPLVGASGAISGMMGAAARFGFRIDRSGDRPAFAGLPLPIGVCLRSRSVVTFLAVWMVVNLVTGLIGLGAGGGMSIAWEAHVGGFLAGFFGIGSFVDWPKRQRRRAQRPAEPDSPEE